MSNSIFIMRIILWPLPTLFLLFFWQMYIYSYPQDEFFIGSPLGIASELVTLINNGMLYNHFRVTALEVLVGFSIGCSLGSIVGLALWYFSLTRFFARPYVLMLGAIPVYALAPALVFWFGNGFISKAIIAFLSTFFVSIAQSFNGASVKQDLFIELFKAFGASKNQIFLKLTVPTAFIWVISGVRLNIGYAILGAFIGELISSREGLGYLIMVAEGLFNINQIWVGIFGLISIAILLNLLVLPLEKWAASKKLV